MELHRQPVTQIKFIDEKKFSDEQINGAKNFLKKLFENESALYKKGITDGSIVLKGGREGTIIKNNEEKTTYKIIGQCIGNIIYVDDIINVS
jgi:hypothetical protein